MPYLVDIKTLEIQRVALSIDRFYWLTNPDSAFFGRYPILKPNSACLVFPPLFCPSFVIRKFLHSSGGGGEGTLVQNAHNSWTYLFLCAPFDPRPVFQHLSLVFGMAIFSKSIAHGHFQSDYAFLSNVKGWPPPTTLKSLCWNTWR